MSNNVSFQSTRLATPATGEIVAAIEKDGAKHQQVIFEGKTGDATYQTPRLDAATHSIQTIDYAHHEVHAGDSYHNEFYVDVLADDILDIRLVTPATTKWLHWVWEYKTEAEFIVTFYEGVTITNPGTALTALNADRNSNNTTGLTTFDYILNTDLAAANADTSIASATIIGKAHSGSGSKQVGEGRRDLELILKQNTGYCIRFDNGTNATKYVDWFMGWYEHTNKTA